MNGFLWSSGHLGWGIFALAVFTCLWLLLADLVWRLLSTRIHKLLVAMSLGWLIGAGIVILVFSLGGT
jgi:hypothetical protein